MRISFLLLINPVILLLGGVAVGTVLAPRLGLRSHLAGRANGARLTHGAASKS